MVARPQCATTDPTPSTPRWPAESNSCLSVARGDGGRARAAAGRTVDDLQAAEMLSAAYASAPRRSRFDSLRRGGSSTNI
jgi:hypothetical protein